MRGWVGALCLSSFECDFHALRHRDEADCEEDRHKAPASTYPLPLSLQMGNERFKLFPVPSRQNQMQIAELVPEVMLTQRLLIGDSQMLYAAKGSQHGNV